MGQKSKRARSRQDPLQAVSFRCPACQHRWDGRPDRVEPCDEQPDHPWRYFAACPKCETESEQVWWERNLLKAWANATGPKTPEGIAATTKNLEGHPTMEERQRYRFNAIKHGLHARVATFYPAKPGGYPHCNGCEYLNNGCGTEHRACLKRTELFLKHRIAFETRDPKLLQTLRADLQANLEALLEDMILAVVKTGAEVRTPEYHFDSEGIMHIAEWIDEKGERRTIETIRAHPLIKMISELVRNNTLSLADLGMTEKQEEQTTIRGNLEEAAGDRENLLEYQRRQAESLEKLQMMIENSRKQAARDPVLIEHQAGETSEDA